LDFRELKLVAHRIEHFRKFEVINDLDAEFGGYFSLILCHSWTGSMIVLGKKKKKLC